MSGSGKSTVAALVASELDVPLTDIDRMVEEATGRSVADLWAIDDGATFRVAETEAVATVAGDPHHCVVAAGGGAVLDPVNVDAMRASGVVVWLEAETGELASRLGDDRHRPLLAGGDLEPRLAAMLAGRRGRYEAAAHHRVSTDGRAPGEVAEEVARLWPGT